MWAHVYKPRRSGKLAKFWSGKIKLDGWSRSRVFALAVTQKEVAEEKLRELVHEFERESVGLPPLHAAKKAHRTAIAGPLAAFLADVEARGRAAATVRVYRVVLGQLCRACGWVNVGDVTESSFDHWRSSGVSPKYANNALGYCRTFFGWMVKRRLMVADPFATLEKIKVREDRGKRFAPSEDQLRRLLETAPPHRALVYLVALYTGLRRFELNGITWGDLSLDAGNPSLRVSGSISKNGRTVTLPLRAEVVDGLRAFQPDACQPFEWVFRGRVPNTRTFRKDAIAAGILVVDEYGRRFDFHALRTTCATLMSVANVPPRVAMELMRHSEMRLTMKTYTDTARLPLAAGLSLLPSFSVPATSTQKRIQTGDKSGQTVVPEGNFGHLLALPENSASVSPCPSPAIRDASGEAGKMVGLVRFELTTSCTPCKRATRLRYSPTKEGTTSRMLPGEARAFYPAFPVAKSARSQATNA